MSTNDAFLEIIAGCTETAASIDLGDSKWKPPDGTYTVELTAVETGTWTKDGVTRSRIVPVFTILDHPEFEGKVFQDFYGIAAGAEDIGSEMSLKGLLNFATCIAGREIRDPVEAVETGTAAVNELMTVEVYRVPSKSGKIFANIRFLAMVATPAN